ncbi:glutaredoxin protein [Serratia phage vB_SmaM-Kashira]|nr:glutaredoxin-related protein [Acinetobacter phage ABPH49]URC22718.1 glutaredoxin protein [Serratia phage vB_SmaM-Kashira]
MSYIVFGKENCPYCVRAKNLLELGGFEYRYLDVGKDGHAFQTMLDWVTDATGTGPKSVPQIFVDEDDTMTYIGGHDDLVLALNKAKTEELGDEDFDF